MNKKVLLNVSDLHKSYGNQSVLAGVDLTLAAGESVAIVGPSGSGKSTLLNLISALDTPDEGAIHLAGASLADMSAKQLAALRNQKIGFVFQLHHLLPQCTVWENILLPAMAEGTADSGTLARGEILLARVGLADKIRACPAELSGGERQRVAIVRALIQQPNVLLADEPTGSCDRKTAEQIIDLLLEINIEQNTALVLVTHSMHLAERMGRIYELQDGWLEQIQSAGEMA